MLDQAKPPAINVSGLDATAREEIHRRLYRSECRGWLLWFLTGMGCLSYAQPLFSKLAWWGDALLGVFVVAYSASLAFWTIVPVQPILTELRRQAGPELQAKIERGFDNSRQSLKDFWYPMVVPIGGVIFWGLRIHWG